MLIVPNNPTFQIQVVKYILPVNLDQQVRTHALDGSITQSSFKKMYKKYDDNIVLRLIKSHERSIKIIDEYIFLNALWVKIAISDDGNSFAYMYSLKKFGLK